MIDNIAKLKGLPLNERKMIVDYSVGLPKITQDLIHIHMNDDFMNPAMIRGNIRNISIYSNLTKYIDKSTNDIHILKKNSKNSDYQSEFCDICERIYDLTDDRSFLKFQNLCIGILSSDSYNVRAFAESEKKIAEVLKCYSLNNIPKYTDCILSFVDMLNKDVILYKAKVYDLYGRYMMSENIECPKNLFTNTMEHTISCINSIIEQPVPGYADQHDLAVFIYKYLELLGIESGFEELGLFERFKYSMIKYNRSDEFITGVYKDIVNIISNSPCLRSASLEVVNPQKYKDIFSISDDYDIEIPSSPIIHKANGMVFFNIEDYMDKTEWMSNEIRKLKKQTISEYVPGSNAFKISFILTDNDFGNIDSLGDMRVCTAYDKFNNMIHRLACYNNSIYLLFKDISIPGYILGISLETVDNSGSRNFLKIKRNKTCTFKYIPNI